MPDGSEVSVEDTEAHSGISVELAVRREDVDAFKERIINFFQFWEPKNRPTFINGSDIEFKEIPKVFGKDNWYLSKKELYVNNVAKVLMGGIVYPIDLKAIPSASNDLMFVGRNNFVIECPIGSLSFQVSREELSYEKLTIQTLESMAEKINNEFKAHIKGMVEKGADTPYQLYHNFHQVNKDLKSVYLKDCTGNSLLQDPIVETFGRHNIEYFKTTKSEAFSMYDLNKHSIKVVQNGYSSLNIMGVNNVTPSSNRGSSRYTLKNEREVSFILPVGNLEVSKPWYRPTIKPSYGAGLTPHNKSAANLLADGLVPVSTKFSVHSYKQYNASYNLTFILNDKGVLEGQKLYREYLNNYKHDLHGYLVSAEDKRSDHGRQEIETMLKGTIFEGCPIILLSDIKEIQELSFVSAPVKEKTVVESTMLTCRTFFFHKNDNTFYSSHLTRGRIFGTSYQTKGVSANGQLVTEKVDDISSFEGMYVIKKGNKIDQEWMFSSSDLPWLAHGGVFDNFLHTKGKGSDIKFYILTEKMVSQLTKKGAKLTNAYDVIHNYFKSPDYISRMDKYKDLYKYEERIGNLEYEFANMRDADSDYYASYIGEILSGVTSSTSFFKTFIERLIDLRKELKKGENLLYDMAITKRFACHYPDVWVTSSPSDDPNNPVHKLYSQYPLLKSLFNTFINIPLILDTKEYKEIMVKDIVEYINLKDSLQKKN
jgi:hypothetical protein